MRAPTTAAGQALALVLETVEYPVGYRGTFFEHIATIEAAARQQERDRIAAAVQALPSACHSHSGLSCDSDWFDGYCALIDGPAVLAIIEAPAA